jgi:6-pyruvoyltetrahydropterin/6-carboxytetrahydropterin synthase
MTKVTISKSFDFDAAHRLPHLPDGHKCKRLHGHTYRVEIRYEGEPDARGMVVDYAEIAEAWQPVHAIIDHNFLNEVEGLENPTTEILAPWILRRMVIRTATKEVPPAAVRVYESATTWCEARAEDVFR